MKTLRKQILLLLGSMTCLSVYLSLPASADSTANLILSLKCQNEYTVNIWKRHNSGELLYRATGPLGNLSLGKGTGNNTGSAQVYKFKNGEYEYQVLGGRGDHQGKGTLEVYKNGNSIFTQTCTPQ
ncbi:hypothetical protein NIES2101_32120 [Calothrix sp. HK-06]|nr:hypothetical protein NIES2101_32120 [Calothrix sp. HK-06]